MHGWIDPASWHSNEEVKRVPWSGLAVSGWSRSSEYFGTASDWEQDF